MIVLHKLHAHVYKEEVDEDKRVRKLSIRSVTRMAESNFKIKQERAWPEYGTGE